MSLLSFLTLIVLILFAGILFFVGLFLIVPLRLNFSALKNGNSQAILPLLKLIMIGIIPVGFLFGISCYAFFNFPNLAQFDHLLKKLFTYPVSKIVLEFERITESEQDAVLRKLDFLLKGSANHIRYHVRGRFSSSTERDVVPAYYQWEENKLTIITGQAFPDYKARWLKQIFELGLFSTQKLSKAEELFFTGDDSINASMKLDLTRARLDMIKEKERDFDSTHSPFICVIAFPISAGDLTNLLPLSTLPLTKKEVIANFSEESSLTQKRFQVYGTRMLSLKKMELLLKISSYQPEKYSLIHKNERCVEDGFLSLEPALQVALAKEALRGVLLELPVKRFDFKPSVSFSPWYTTGHYQAVM